MSKSNATPVAPPPYAPQPTFYNDVRTCCLSINCPLPTRRFWTSLFVTVMTLGFLVGMGASAWQFQSQLDTHPSTIGTITKTIINKDGHYCNSGMKDFIVHYNYTIDEIVFHGSYIPDGSNCIDQSDIDEYAGKYPVGDQLRFFIVKIIPVKVVSSHGLMED